METYWRKKGAAFTKVKTLQPLVEVPRALLPGKAAEKAGKENKENDFFARNCSKH